MLLEISVDIVLNGIHFDGTAAMQYVINILAGF